MEASMCFLCFKCICKVADLRIVVMSAAVIIDI